MMNFVCFGEILLRLSPPDHQRLIQASHLEAVYGGSEANVAVSLSQFGMRAAYMTRVPDNEMGQAALNAVARYGVDTRYAVRGGDRLGIYFLEQGAGRRGSKVLYDRAGSGMGSLKPGQIDWRAALENASWLHWSGITPALSASAAEAMEEGLHIARELKVTISCDLNYRANLWQYGKTPLQVMKKLVGLTDVVLGDATAFDICLGVKITRTDEPSDLLAAVKEHYPNLWRIAMTRRAGNSASHNAYQGILYDGQKTYTSPLHDLPDMLDRIGGGDAFMAGLILGLQKAGEDLQDIVDFAVAAAALKHYVPGDFNLSSVEEVRALMAGNTGGKVSR